MPRLRNSTIRRLFTPVNVAITGLAVVLVSASSATYDAFAIHERTLRLLKTEAEMISPDAALAVARNDRDAAAVALKALRADSQVLAAGIFRTDGVAFFTYVRSDPSSAAALGHASEGDGHMVIGDHLLVYRAINLDGANVGSVRLVSEMEGLRATLVRHLAAAALVFVAVIAATLPARRRRKERASTPIPEMVSNAGVVSGESNYRVGAPTLGEQLGTLYRTSSPISLPGEKGEESSDESNTEASKRSVDEGQLVLPVKEVEQEVVSQAQFIEHLLGVLEALRVSADVKGVRLQVVVDPREIAVAIDSQALKHIFWNLMSNAVKFSSHAGRVQIVARRIESHVEISVSDTGCGIDRERLPLVFNETPTAHGLSVVRHLVEQHGGRVRAESAGEGQGATFTVALPIASLPEERD